MTLEHVARHAGLVPCAVIVDSQNVRGQARKAFGHDGGTPDADGIRSALRGVGFDPVEVHVAVADSTLRRRPTPRLAKVLRQNQEYAATLEAAGVNVLRGNLIEHRNGDRTEKQVDVLCAVTIAEITERVLHAETEARCIVMLTEDMDLMPAYRFAEERRVPVYAAAYDTVYHRQKTSWLLLDEPMMRQICPPPGEKSGSDLGAYIADTLLSSESLEKPSMWRPIRALHTGDLMFTNNRGAIGLLKADVSRQWDKAKQGLFVAGVETVPSNGQFPRLRLSEEALPAEARRSIAVGQVRFWTEPTRVRVQLDDETIVNVTAAAGSLLPGQRVMVGRTETTTGNGEFLVGALDRVEEPDRWPGPTRTAVVRVVREGLSSGWSEAVIEGTDRIVLLHRKWLQHATVGRRVRAVLIGQKEGVPCVMPLSCCLQPTESIV